MKKKRHGVFSRRSNSASSQEFGSISDYCKDIGSYTLLTRKDEVELFNKIKQGDDSARQKVIESNLRLVVSMARRYVGYGISLEDLVSEGNVGLMKAVSRFDIDRGFKFSTYASWWIFQAITRCFREQLDTVRIPSSRKEEISKMKKAYKNVSSSLNGRKPTIGELASYMNISPEEIRNLIRDSRLNSGGSLNSESQQNKNSNSGKVSSRINSVRIQSLSPEGFVVALEEIETCRVRIAFMKGLLLLSCIGKKERGVFEKYVFQDKDSKRPNTERGESRLEDVGDLFGITREGVRQILLKVWKKLVILKSPFSNEKAFREELQKMDDLAALIDVKIPAEIPPLVFSKKQQLLLLKIFEEAQNKKSP